MRVRSGGNRPTAGLAVLALCATLSALAAAQGAPSKAASGRAVVNAVPDVARPLPLSAVRITGGPLKRAQELNAEYLLSLEPDRMMAFFRQRVGLPAKAEPYGGWDGDGRNLTGHIAGHYLSAVSLMWAATGDQRFKERADRVVEEMKLVQDKHGDGYLGALANGKERFAEVAHGDIRSKSFELNGLWSPWYVLHKIYAGLRDAYRYTGNRTALALEIGFAGWAESVLSKLDDAQLQRMLNTEFGGMNEVLADLYADTGDRRWLQLSHRFDHRAVLGPLERQEDRLGGLHGNTQVPKLFGSLVRYAIAGDASDGAAATFFWDRVAHHHSFATGGHGKEEYFGEPDDLSDRIDGRTAETCNVYNMLKMTRRLFALRPEVQYAEFHERALFNHILASMDSEDGRTCYMVPVGRGVRHEYQDMHRDFTCCVGSGMESHALHGDGIYYEAKDRLWVNLYASSTADWKSTGTRLSMESGFPEGDSSTLTLSAASPKRFTLALRRPSWAGEGFGVGVNGTAVKDLPGPGSYVELDRTWKGGDKVTVVTPKSPRLEPLPDNPRRVAIIWGPLVLAGDLGPEADRERGTGAGLDVAKVPVFVAEGRPIEEWLKPVPGKPGSFRTAGVGRESDVDFAPLYRLHRRLYGVYWDVYTNPEWESKAAEYAAEREREHKLDLVSVGHVRPGDGESEGDFNYQGPEDAAVEWVLGRAGRRGRSWFSFDLPVDPAHPMALLVTYRSDEQRRQRTFEILVDGHRVGEQEVERTRPPRFFDVEYPVAAEVVKGKRKVTVRFQATRENEIATVFGIRIIRTDAER